MDMGTMLYGVFICKTSLPELLRIMHVKVYILYLFKNVYPKRGKAQEIQKRNYKIKARVVVLIAKRWYQVDTI